ncbi:MAG: energy transducer TonB [Acidobacteriaceae bacterium]
MTGNLIAAPPPEYPRLAGMFHVEGQVILQAVVSRNGRVVATHVLRGHRLLRGAAEQAVRRWRYRPFFVNGQSTDVATIVTVNFRRQ